VHASILACRNCSIDHDLTLIGAINVPNDNLPTAPRSGFRTVFVRSPRRQAG
jgi:hypothetical protein